MQSIDNEQDERTSGLDLNAILLALFRHKTKVIVCTAIGIAAAAAVHFLVPPTYRSEAKLLVRYVIDRSTVDSVESKNSSTGAFAFNDSVISGEQEILSSWDLALEVAELIGVSKLAPKETDVPPNVAAARVITEGLKVSARKGSNVLLASYENTDPELATSVLDELVNQYFAKHLEVHRSVGAFAFVTEQTDQVRGRLRQTEGDLKQLKEEAGIVSLSDGTATLNASLARAQEELLAAEAERAEQLARVNEMDRWLANKEDSSGSAASGARSKRKETDAQVRSLENALPAPRDIRHQHQLLLDRIAFLRKAGFELQAKFTPQSTTVKLNQAQLESYDKQRRDLERKYPSLVVMASGAVASGDHGSPLELVAEKSRLAALDAKVETLKRQLGDLQEQSRRFSEASIKIAELERRKEVDETNYKYFESSLEKARIDEALDPSKIPNISIVQKPSPAERLVGKERKVKLGLALGGLVFGVALACMLELVFDRSIKHRLELETSLRIPLFLSIPRVLLPGPRLMLRGGERANCASENSISELTHSPRARREIAPWEPAHFIRPFAEEVRDRLILFFQLKRMTHKPKLVALTGMAEGAGTSTLAAGLAAALSEIERGKVLFVDMNTGHDHFHPFFKGKPAPALGEALRANGHLPSAVENLYLATAATSNGKTLPLASQRLCEMLPHLKKSGFDYVIFDLPPVDKGSATLAMSGYMDKVLLVIEAEKTHRDLVKRAYSELVAAKAQVSGILNKTQAFAPTWLAAKH